MDEVLRTRLVESAITDSLVVFCGAGLSMAAPSSLPSAAALAESCVDNYSAQFGIPLPAELDTDLEQIAQHFWSQGSFQQTFINRVVPWQEFRSQPNSGHDAIADFLGCGIIHAAVSTNYDTLIETAADRLGEPAFEACLDGDEAAVSRRHKPLLKLHGCYRRQRSATVWCTDQVKAPPLQQRIAASGDWLRANLRQKDLIFVGFWSDWAYLNKILETCVSRIEPRTVVLVDPANPIELEAKAPTLWNLHTNGAVVFHHVSQSGSDFLDELRREYSINFMGRLLAASESTYTALCAGASPPKHDFDTTLTATEYYELRRDLTGAPAGTITRAKDPAEHMYMAGAAILFLKQAGAVTNGSYMQLNETSIRVVQANGPLSLAKRKYSESVASPASEPEIVVCAGAFDDGGVPPNVARGTPSTTIVRPSSGSEWVTLQAAIDLFGKTSHDTA